MRGSGFISKQTLTMWVTDLELLTIPKPNSEYLLTTFEKVYFLRQLGQSQKFTWVSSKNKIKSFTKLSLSESMKLCVAKTLLKQYLFFVSCVLYYYYFLSCYRNLSLRRFHLIKLEFWSKVKIVTCKYSSIIYLVN